jgi:hypothetical protein
MKATKKQKKILPEVHILGDLQDVKNLISGVNKKKTLVIFQDGEQESFYLEIEGKFQQILQTDITLLEKEYRLIFFSFFPGRKKVDPLTEEKPEEQEPENSEIKTPKKKEKQKKKVKTEKKVKKVKKGKKDKKKK